MHASHTNCKGSSGFQYFYIIMFLLDKERSTLWDNTISMTGTKMCGPRRIVNTTLIKYSTILFYCYLTLFTVLAKQISEHIVM